VLAELLRLCGAIGVTLTTVAYAPSAARFLLQWSQLDPTMVTFVVFWLIFLTGVVSFRLLLKHCISVFAWERVYPASQLGGLLLGTARGIWWAAVMLVALRSSQVERLQTYVERSMLGGPFAEASQQLIDGACGYMLSDSEQRSGSLFPPVINHASHSRQRAR
jgi:uncharacterized membrane protein required for colicin V production